MDKAKRREVSARFRPAAPSNTASNDFGALSNAVRADQGGTPQGNEVPQVLLFGGRRGGSRLAHFYSAQAAAKGISAEGRSGRAATVSDDFSPTSGSDAAYVVAGPGQHTFLNERDITTPGGRQEAVANLLANDSYYTETPNLPVVAKDPKKRKRMAARSDRPGLVADPKPGVREGHLRRKNMLGD